MRYCSTAAVYDGGGAGRGTTRARESRSTPPSSVTGSIVTPAPPFRPCRSKSGIYYGRSRDRIRHPRPLRVRPRRNRSRSGGRRRTVAPSRSRGDSTCPRGNRLRPPRYRLHQTRPRRRHPWSRAARRGEDTAHGRLRHRRSRQVVHRGTRRRRHRTGPHTVVDSPRRQRRRHQRRRRGGDRPVGVPRGQPGRRGRPPGGTGPPFPRGDHHLEARCDEQPRRTPHERAPGARRRGGARIAITCRTHRFATGPAPRIMSGGTLPGPDPPRGQVRRTPPPAQKPAPETPGIDHPNPGVKSCDTKLHSLRGSYSTPWKAGWSAGASPKFRSTPAQPRHGPPRRPWWWDSDTTSTKNAST